jgi:hypothetical protein
MIPIHIKLTINSPIIFASNDADMAKKEEIDEKIRG